MSPRPECGAPLLARSLSPPRPGLSAADTQARRPRPHPAPTTRPPRRTCGTRAAPTTSAAGWPWLVSSPAWERPAVGTPGGRDAGAQALTSPSLHAGMPTAYDLSSVIAGGSSVGHNNLIPLGECPPGSGGNEGRRPGTSARSGFLRRGVSTSPFPLPGAPGGGPLFRSSLPRSAAAVPTLPTPQ